MRPGAAPQVCAGRSVLELGAGVGLCGLCAAELGAARVVLSDGDPRLVSRTTEKVRSHSIACKEAHGLFLGQ